MYKAKLKQAALVMLNLILWGGMGAMLAYRG